MPAASSVSTAAPATRGDDDDDPKLEDVVPVDRITKFSAYRRTQRLVVEGQPLWSLGKSELSRRGLMNAWTFNIYQSILSAAPLVLYNALHSFLAPAAANIGQGIDGVLPQDASSVFAGQIASILTPIVLPLSLAIISYAAASGSLRPEDRTPARRKKARRAYLYLDGAFGLWSQMALTTFLGLTAAGHDWALLGVAVAIVIQTRLTWYVVPAAIFRVNGYPDRYPSWRFWQKDALRAQWNRYQVWTTSLAFVVLLLAPVVSITSYFGGLALASLQSTFQGSAP